MQKGASHRGPSLRTRAGGIYTRETEKEGKVRHEGSTKEESTLDLAGRGPEERKGRKSEFKNE